MDGWDKAKVLISLAATVGIPGVVFFVGNNYSRALKEREIQGKYVELAISILQAPLSQQSAGIRQWAADVINRYSGVPLSDRTREDLVRTGALEDIGSSLLSGMLRMDTIPRARTAVADSFVVPHQRREGVTVPDLIGLNLAQAKMLAERIGLSLREMSLASPNPTGVPDSARVIVRQQPQAGFRVAPRSVVQVVTRITEITMGAKGEGP